MGVFYTIISVVALNITIRHEIKHENSKNELLKFISCIWIEHR